MTFRNLLIMCTLLFISSSIHAQNNAWVQKIDGQVDYLNVAVSPNGTEYLAIQFRDTISYAPEGDSTYSYGALDNFTVCLLKLDEAQKPIESYRYSMTFDLFVRNMIATMKIDGNGNLYVSGGHIELIFDEFGDTIVPFRIDENPYIMQLDSNLQMIQSFTYGGSNNIDHISDFEINEKGTITLGGLMTAFFDYDLREDSVVRLPNPNSGSPFLAQYDQDFNLINAQIFISKFRDRHLALETDDNGGIYTLMSLTDSLLIIKDADSIWLDPGTTPGWLVTHYDPAGQLVWYKSILPSDRLDLLGFERDEMGILHIVGGTYADTLLLGDSLLSSTEDPFRFWMELDQNGTLMRFRSVDIPFPDSRAKFYQSTTGEFFISGRKQSAGIFDFDGREPRDEVNNREFYLARYSQDGTFVGATGLDQLVIQEIPKVDFYPDGAVSLILEHQINAPIDFNPIPTGQVVTDENSNLTVSRFCYPLIDDISLEQTCAGDEIILTADPSYSSVSYFDAATLEKLADSLIVGVTNDRDSIIVVLRDQNNCPNYAVILVDLDCNTTAVDELAFKKTRVYPNPAQNEVIIQGNTVTEVTVGDMSGNIILKNKGRVAENLIDLSGLLPGLYWLRFTLEDGTVEHHKLIMQP